jgi:hypothetical protein
MFAIVILAASAAVGAIGALAVKYGPEDRPGFDERTPLS